MNNYVVQTIVSKEQIQEDKITNKLSNHANDKIILQNYNNKEVLLYLQLTVKILAMRGINQAQTIQKIVTLLLAKKQTTNRCKHLIITVITTTTLVTHFKMNSSCKRMLGIVTTISTSAITGQSNNSPMEISLNQFPNESLNLMKKYKDITMDLHFLLSSIVIITAIKYIPKNQQAQCHLIYLLNL